MSLSSYKPGLRIRTEGHSFGHLDTHMPFLVFGKMTRQPNYPIQSLQCHVQNVLPYAEAWCLLGLPHLHIF